jgi:hypothetical protein
MLQKDSDASQLSGGQVAGQNQLLDILGRQGSNFNAGPFFHFGGVNRTPGGLSDQEFGQLTPQFAKAAAMSQLLGIGTGPVGVASAEGMESDRQQQEAAMVIAQIIGQLGQNKGNVDPGPSQAATTDPFGSGESV